MFSQRVRSPLAANPLGRMLAEKGQAGVQVLDLTESNPTRAGIVYPEAEILGSLAERGALLYEPAPRGLLAAREAVAGYYAARGHADCLDRLILTASTSEAYSLLIKLLADPGDNLLVPRPSYPLLEMLAGAEGVGVRHYALECDDSWSIDLESLRHAIDDRSRAILLVNPNNPTGSWVKERELPRLLESCREHGLALVVDEVFADYDWGLRTDGVRSFAGVDDVLTFVLSGLSKVAGLPQMKLAWICAGGPPAQRAEALERLEYLNDLLLSASAPVLHAAAALLDLAPVIRGRILQRVALNRARLAEVAGPSSAVGIRPGEAGWQGVLRLPGVRDSEEWALGLLDRESVYLHPGYLFDFAEEAHLVVSLLTLPETLDQGLEQLSRHVSAVLG